MTTEAIKTIRIFISSPGDVQEERNRAKAVVEQLRRSFAGRLELEAVLWEELPLQADMSFQEGIDLVLSDKGIDIAVFILWSRLGSPTGPLMVGDDKRTFRSGTEREWQLMLQSRDQCIQNGLPPRPAIIAYTRRDDESFVERLRGKSDEERAKELEQKKAVAGFIKEEFKDSETGTNIRAYHSFDQPTTFAKQLRTHLSALLETMCSDASEKLYWDPSEKGPPFRGLDVFEFEHSPIFFGREDEIVAIRSQLREQACRGCAFLLISGPSGSGKSSLVRAGVLPDVCAHELDSEIHRWRWLAVRPSELGEDMLAGLIQKLASQEVLPELKEWSEDIEVPSNRKDLREWISVLVLRVKDALKAAGKGGSRLIVLVDQLEELFSQKSSEPEESRGFFEVIEALARSRLVWVVATVRSDFYQECQKVPSLVQMKQGLGHFDLLPPGPNDLLRVITRPAAVAGLRFEQQGEKNLADLILKEAVGQGELLPLLEHLLLDLYEHRSEDGILTLERYQTIQGLQGALRKHCEKTYDGLSVGSQEAFGRVLSQLVNLSGENLDTAVRRTIPVKTFQADQDASELVGKLVQARLLSTGVDLEGNALVSVSHEAVLRSWPKVTKWIELNRENLRIRSRLESEESRYREQPDESLLLQRGVRLQEAKKLLETGPELLTPEASEFVRKSIALDDAKTMRQKRNWVLALGLLACAAVGTYWYIQRSARTTRVDGLVASLIESDPERLVENIEKLNSEFDAAEPLLRKNISAENSSPENERRILHSKLALVSRDPSLIGDVTEAYFTKGVSYLLPIRQILSPRGDSLAEPMTKRLKDSAENPEARLRAAVALAEFQKQPSDLDWDQETTQFVAEQLVSANPEFQPIYRKGLRSIKEKLVGALTGLFTDKSLKETQSLSAASSLADYAGDDPLKIADLLTEATPEQYAILFPLIEKGITAQAVSKLKEVASSLPADDLGSVPRIAFGQRRADAAVTMLKLGEKESVLPVFNWTDDPEALTQFIFRCKPRGIPVGTLLDLLDLVSEDPMKYPKDTRYALLLSIGEYGRSEIPASRCETLIKKLADWYANDPSSGVHGAAGWLLRQLGEKEVAEGVDQQMELYSPDREWFTLAITVQPEEDESNVSNGKPSKKTFYFTLIIFPQGEYLIGSPEDETDRYKFIEVRHKVVLTRPFALLDREVTYDEMISFRRAPYAKRLIEGRKSLNVPCDEANWYDSVAFCRWLGLEMGLTETDQCYPDPETLNKEEYPRDPNVTWAPENWPLDLSKRGFRLPTKSEWEIAARSRSRTSYGFGSEVSLLDRFGWFTENSGKKVHPGREKRPSMRGMFDLHGNLFEWTHDCYAEYDDSSQTDPQGPNAGSLRVFRGGSCYDEAARCRSAYENCGSPSNGNYSLGFRVALSCPSGIPQSPEPDK
jgi:formylglycine-generating enzyme required for sulfatase activity